MTPPPNSPPNFVAMPRIEPEHARRWGLYSAREDRWLDVVFGSRREAEEAFEILRRAPPAPRRNKSL